MSLNDTPSGERVHIGFFGRRNAGKSSVVNAVTGQDLAVVSDVKGTTTDPVRKAMELLPMGPVVICDTPGADDEGELGELRVRKTRQELNRTDVAVLVVDASEGISPVDRQLVSMFREKNIPYITAYNKCDLLDEEGLRRLEKAAEAEGHDGTETGAGKAGAGSIFISCRDGSNINELKEMIAALTPEREEKHLVADLVSPGDLVILVIPIDESAPKGRIILPQQQVLRDVLDRGAEALCLQDSELEMTLGKLKEPPALVITDSQVFDRVAAVLPEDVPLTSFSIILARYKGFLDEAVKGVLAIEEIEDGDHILISEGCSHHRQCEDIGTVKIPSWLRKYTGKDFKISTSSGREFPEDLSPYRLVIHCGACMLGEKEVLWRMKNAVDQGVLFTNYGISIAYLQGILRRGVSPFPKLAEMFEGK